MDVVKEGLTRVGYLFYIVNPKDHMYRDLKDIPHYTTQVVPLFLSLAFLEFLVAIYRGKKHLRINDGFGSISQGILMELSKFVVSSMQIVAYVYIYENWRMFSLPWDSHWTWIIAFFGADLGYYWLHRGSHEINVLWAAHQVHHSSEDYNLSTALRQSVVQGYVTWMFYLPLALAVPPSVFLVHNQFNLLYQFWIHTEVVDKLGPLEYVLNTPSHHRVHHGRNRYCIDKNYAGVLIIWDRMFGTFCPEDEKVVYGLTHPINTLDPWTTQMCHYVYIVKLFFTTKGFSNKLSVLFKGPGWSPGKPRLGELEDIPDVHYPMEAYDPQIQRWSNIYVLVHFFIVVVGYLEIATRHTELSHLTVLGGIMFIIFSFTSIAAVLDKKDYAFAQELLRCALFLFLDSLSYYWGLNQDSTILHVFIRWCYIVSAIFWVIKLCGGVTLKIHTKKTK